jgi:hypothetical protein
VVEVEQPHPWCGGLDNRLVGEGHQHVDPDRSLDDAEDGIELRGDLLG